MTEQQRKQANVRRAVRLLAAYHTRLLDALQRIEAVADEEVHGLRFLRWQPTHHHPVDRPGTSPLHRWGWDFVPLQNTTFCWTTNADDGPKKPGQLAIFVQHIADDGYDSGLKGRRGPDPTRFRDADACGSWLWLWAFKLTSGACAATWDEVEAAYEAAEFGEQDWDGERHEVVIPGLPTAGSARFAYVGWQVRVEDIGTDEEFHRLVLGPLRSRLRLMAATG